MYQVLYRKWRPKTFEDVSGQEHITTTLKNELVTGRINHAYLFTGSRGTGKTTCAKILAKAVNCENLQNGNPCGECESCKGIDNGSVLDILEMDAASNRKIDNIRQIIDECQFKPAKCKYRVYIIDEVHMLTTEAFNALLKTLEEPPEHVIFILATTEVHKIPQTILSRCQRFDFHRIEPKKIADRLIYVSQQEKVQLSDSAALMVAAIADGAMRDALSLLDRCIAISSNIDEDVVRTAAGLVQKNYLFSLAVCIINKNTAKALEIIDGLYADSKDMSRLCEELLEHFRALMLIKSVNSARNILIMSEDEFDKAQTQADYLSLADIVYYMDVLSRAFQRMGKGTGDRTEFEMALVKLSSPELDATNEAVTARITALEKAVRSGNFNSQSISESNITQEPKTENSNDNTENNNIQNQQNVIQSNNTVSANNQNTIATEQSNLQPITEQKPVVKPTVPSVSAEELCKNAKPFDRWTDIVETFAPISRVLSAAFAGTMAYVSGDYLLIDNSNEMAFEILKKSAKRQEIKKILLDVTGKNYKLGPYKQPKKEEKKLDPLQQLKESLENSGVEITEE